METKKRKKALSWKRIQRIAKSVVKEIKNYFKSLVQKFNSLPKHIKMITGVWVGVVLVIIIIIVASTGNKKHLNNYYDIEKALVEATNDYLADKEIYPVKDSKLKLDIDTLEEFSSLNNKNIDAKSCKGFTMTYYNEDSDEYVVKPYIKCDKYTTDEYDDYK